MPPPAYFRGLAVGNIYPSLSVFISRFPRFLTVGVPHVASVHMVSVGYFVLFPTVRG